MVHTYIYIINVYNRQTNGWYTHSTTTQKKNINIQNRYSSLFLSLLFYSFHCCSSSAYLFFFLLNFICLFFCDLYMVCVCEILLYATNHKIHTAIAILEASRIIYNSLIISMCEIHSTKKKKKNFLLV